MIFDLLISSVRDVFLSSL